MERRSRLGILALSLGLVLSFAWGYSQLSARRQAETMLGTRYQQAFFDALGHIENVEVLLSKALVSGSPRESIRYLSELWQQAFSAQANLNALPLRQGTLMRTSRFLTQLGDYSFVVGQKVATGESVSESDWQTLQRLHHEISALGVELTDVALKSADGQMPWEEIRQRTNLNLNPFSKRLDGADGQVDGFTRIEQQMQEFPTLVYDGPFSDHIGSRKPVGITGDPVDSFAAREIAQRFVSMSDNGGTQLVAQQVAQTGEDAPIGAWRIEVSPAGADQPSYVMDVSKEGGHVIWMLDSRPVSADASGYTLGDAVSIAQRFLEERGYEQFEVTYPVVESGRAIVPFVLVEGDVLIYPDQLKVTVALDSGQVVGYDAMQYFTFHHQRTLAEPKLSVEEARSLVRSDLAIEEVRLALIPKPDLKEVLTYEIRARMNEMLYHVYINAETGDEEQILRIIEHEDEGRMAI